MVYLTALAALLLGWLAGLWTFRRTLRWCPRCGKTLSCSRCAHTNTHQPARS